MKGPLVKLKIAFEIFQTVFWRSVPRSDGESSGGRTLQIQYYQERQQMVRGRVLLYRRGPCNTSDKKDKNNKNEKDQTCWSYGDWEDEALQPLITVCKVFKAKEIEQERKTAVLQRLDQYLTAKVNSWLIIKAARTNRHLSSPNQVDPDSIKLQQSPIYGAL